MRTRSSAGVAVAAQVLLVAIGLGVVVGLAWWWIAPTEQWTLTADGVLPADPGYSAWFGADGWFLLLGAAGGVALTALCWRRGRSHPVALTLGVIVGSGLLALGAWALGGALGPVDPQTLVGTTAAGTTVDGALGIRATGVLLAPLLAALTLLALLLAGAGVEAEAPEPAGASEGLWVPHQSG